MFPGEICYNEFMPKGLLFAISLTVILISALLVYITNNNSSRAGKSEIDTAVNQAKYLYQLKKTRGEDFSNGPCLTNALMPGWVADIVHNPRQPIDDLQGNQCSGFVEGTSQHFVELDIDGNFVRAR